MDTECCTFNVNSQGHATSCDRYTIIHYHICPSWPEVKQTVNRHFDATTPLVFFPKSFLMLPSGKLKLPSSWFIVYTVICCVNISGCYMKYASFPTFWKTHGARMFPQFLANGTRIVDSWPKWDKHHCRLSYMYESSLHCLPNQWWQWSIACMCAFTFICLHIYINIYTFFLSHSWCLLLYWPCLMWQYRPRI